MGQAWSLEHLGYYGTLTIRDLAERRRYRHSLKDITNVEIIGGYVKNFD